MTTSLKVLVCVKKVIDPNLNVSVRSDGLAMQMSGLRTTINPFDEVAVEEAIRMRESGVVEEVVAVSVGEADCRDVLRTALAMGADRAILVETKEDPEPLSAARCLAAVIRQQQPDLVLTGKQSTDHDYGQTPGMIGALLGWPQALQASEMVLLGDSLQVTCELDKGTEIVEVKLPAVVSADLRLNVPRYASLPAVIKAKKKPLEMVTVAALGVSDSLQARLQVVRVEVPPVRSGGRVLSNAQELVKVLREETSVLSEGG